MSGAGHFDFTKTGGLRAAAEWIRSKSDAIVVMVIRGEDYAYAVDERCAPSDAAELVRELLPPMVEDANRRRTEKRDAETRKRAAAIAGHRVV
jgi:hypothetical protein